MDEEHACREAHAHINFSFLDHSLASTAHRTSATPTAFKTLHFPLSLLSPLNSSQRVNSSQREGERERALSGRPDPKPEGNFRLPAKM
jgi:hypothetical protein